MYSKLKKSNQGVAAIEFAIILPFLLIVFYGAVELSRYVLAVRHVDLVANDIGYLLSREGCITKDDNDVGDTSCFNGTNTSTNGSNGGIYSGGEAYLQNVFNSIIPLDMYPFAYQDPSSGNLGGTNLSNSEVRIGYVGLPVFSCPTTPDNVDRVTGRIMWADDYPAANLLDPIVAYGNSTSIALDGGPIQFTPCQGSNCPVPNCQPATGAVQVYNSFFHGSESLINVTYPGQSFLLSRFRYHYQPLLGDAFPGINSTLPLLIQKFSTYAVRSEYIGANNGTTAVTSSDIVNAMQYCTTCVDGSSKWAGHTPAQCLPDSTLQMDANTPRSSTNYVAAQNAVNSLGCSFSN